MLFIILQHTMVLEDGEEDPIMEIKEWLDDSGQQTSVDVTDLGKVFYLHGCGYSNTKSISAVFFFTRQRLRHRRVPTIGNRDASRRSRRSM